MAQAPVTAGGSKPGACQDYTPDPLSGDASTQLQQSESRKRKGITPVATQN